MATLKRTPFHPILFGLYPVIALLANNIREVKLAVVTRPLILALGIVIIFTLILRLFLGDYHRAAAASSILSLLTLSYGHIYSLIHQPNVLGVTLARHRFFLPIILAIAAIWVWWVARKMARPRTFTSAFNFMSIVILIFPILQIADFQIRTMRSRSGTGGSLGQVDLDLDAYRLPGGETPPDIYYIILDGYGRDDVLKEFFDIDNAPFLATLEDLGFYIPRCSQANYAMTTLSLTSSLNMTYIEDLDINLDQVDLFSFTAWAHHSKVRTILENLGYQIVSFESGYYVTEWRDSDLFYSVNAAAPRLTSGLNPFESIFLGGTIGKVLVDFQYLLPDEVSVFLNSAYTEHREIILYTIDTLEELAKMEGPKFVMAHIIAPHEPFVFGPNGEFVTQTETFTLKGDIFRTDKEDYLVGYGGQVRYLNTRVEQLARTLISESHTPPIIIFQGDHGPLGGPFTSSQARMSILNAYYLPGAGNQDLYPTISPVNSFRVILNTYFSGELEMLDDVAYISGYNEPFRFHMIQETRDGCFQE
jgi:hypothetical protein